MTETKNRTAIDAANAMFMDAFINRNIDTMLGLYTDDAVVVQPDGSHYTGREAIKTWLTVLVDKTPEGETLDLKTESMFESSDGTIVEDGVWKHVSSNGETQQQGNYVAVWCCNDGRWQIHRDVILAN
jgi:uncharacterized protein (TIGR02246 family)